VAGTRILIVDDSVVARRLLSELFEREPDCEVVGAAAGGRIAIARIPQLTPDLVTLDVEMPDFDGLETLEAIRRVYPHLPVIMVSGLTERAAEITVKALALGATDYVQKPTSSRRGSPLDQLRADLLPKVRGLAARHAGMNVLGSGRAAQQDGPGDARGRPSGQLAAMRPSRERGAIRDSGRMPVARPSGPMANVRDSAHMRVGRPSGQLGAVRASGQIHAVTTPRGLKVEVLAIGSSTGGPNVLASIIPQLRGDLPVPVVITQHMPPVFTRLLAERLESTSALRVREASGGEQLEAGHVYIAPGDFHMEVRRDGPAIRLALTQGPMENSCRPAVDVMLRSVVQVYGAGTLALILTGMGQDGLRACEQVRQAGGQIVVQDEATSVVWGMPGTVARAGLADTALPTEAIAADVMRRIFLWARAGAPQGLPHASVKR
jgi:two-component system chemotaxis response regulator CheB